nr:hypothetical protein [uncultured Allomuricauda sp.]
MRHLLKICIICCVVFSCSNNSSETFENDNLAFSLKAPNGEILADNIQDLSQKLASDASSLEIIGIEYFNVEQKGKLAAMVDYNVNNKINKVLIVRNIKNFNFEKGTVLKFDNQTKTKNNTSKIGGDIYISCSGGSCCYPSGSYNPNTGTITTSCKCDNGGDHSQCVMKISETSPENGPGNQQE